MTFVAATSDEQDKIDNVKRELVPKIGAALGVREFIQILYRAMCRWSAPR
jgi:hypothetical protein